ncbi:MAG: hypothetical protein NTV24_01385 [Candidatus Woesebacteria bacterium]|nr:hypothetical protein [Candidatus Woesebacteria bacterium]
MATIVNNPPSSDNSSGPLTAVVVIIGLIILGYFGYRYGLPAIRQMTSGGATINVNVNQPTP